MHRFLIALLGACACAVPARSQTCYQITQSFGNDTFGALSTGQSFTPGVDVVPDAGANPALPLTEITLFHGNYAPSAPSATTYLNIYDGDPNAGGSFVGSSTDTVDTTSLSFRDPMRWTFPAITLNVATEYWAIMSSTNAAGGIDIAVSLETELRNGPPGPNVYTGGSGLIANINPHPNSVDAKFEIRFAFALPASFTTSGAGCAGGGGNPTVSSTEIPRLGQSFTVDCANLPTSAANSFSVLGFSAFGAPIDLSGLGMTNCVLYSPTDIVTPTPVSSGQTSLTLTIPNELLWLNVTLYYQWFTIDPTANPLGLTSSDSGAAFIGC